MAIAHAVSEFLRNHQIPYDVLAHPHSETSLRAARAAGVPADRLVKAVVLDSDDGLVVVLLPASRMVQLSAVERQLGCQVRVAPPKAFERSFGDCEPGAVPATAQAYGLTTLWDESLSTEADLYFEAGDHEELIHVDGDQFRDTLGANRCGAFSREIV